MREAQLTALQKQELRYHFSLDEYFAIEEEALEKHEFRDGDIVAMAGGTESHSLITMNFGGELRDGLKGKPCRAYDSNLRVLVPQTPLYTYPDVFAICGPTQYDPKDPRQKTVTNPRLVVEVLSPSTEAYDRGEKFLRYLGVESLQEYVLVSQHTPRVETYFREEDGAWRFGVIVGLEKRLVLRSVGVELPLAEVYANVTFPPEPEMPTEPTVS